MQRLPILRIPRGAALASVALVAALVVAACGSSSPSSSASKSSTTANAASTTASGGSTTSTTANGAAGAARTGAAGAAGPGGAKLQACLQQHGVTLPQRPRDGAPGAGTAPNGAPPPGGRDGAPGAGTAPNGAPPPGGGLFGGGRGGHDGGRFLHLSAAQRQKLQAALKACGANFRTRRLNPASNATYRVAVAKFAQCVRTHGYDLPNPNFSGAGPVFDPKKVNRNDPKFAAAAKACQSLLPQLRRGGAGG